MKKTLLSTAVLAMLALTGCEKTVNNPTPVAVTPATEAPATAPATQVVTVPTPVPGPAGAPGPAGPQGPQGAEGKPGDAVVVVPPAGETPSPAPR
jgi:hypothetical protein